MSDFCGAGSLRGCPLPPWPASLDETWKCKACGRDWVAFDPVTADVHVGRVWGDRKPGFGWRGLSRVGGC